MRNSGCGVLILIGIILGIIDFVAKGFNALSDYLRQLPEPILASYILFILFSIILHNLIKNKERRIREAQQKALKIPVVPIDFSQHNTNDLFLRLGEIEGEIEKPMPANQIQQVHSEGICIFWELSKRVKESIRHESS